MKLLIMQSYPDSYHFLSLCPYIPLSTLFSDTLNLRYSLSVRDQVLHSYKITGKIVVYFNLWDSWNKHIEPISSHICQNHRGMSHTFTRLHGQVTFLHS